MTLAEWWLLYDAKIGGRKYGTLSESDVERLYDMID